eukprot:CAMPEP_0202892702 /NCGR_PEP_ID=MMETSP1392-20130828/2403_1 /ASSEMBLY_ACC=CAM_ASM_000868 /TAXON_ID=225041 /ORGANISM="Chlamydomonas chlamydogama, Strain SAG 11-48b" /LENGTH=71 /DNA_ID=CAMNT_0049576757 /DNA_START=106 /DNA_END=317 /DNA_ORIENTATION=-
MISTIKPVIYSWCHEVVMDRHDLLNLTHCQGPSLPGAAASHGRKLTLAGAAGSHSRKLTLPGTAGSHGRKL